MKIITIGRDNSCDIVVNNQRVSRIHANIFQDGLNYTYRDMSTNGTLVNGATVQRSDIHIKFGDSVLLAGTTPLPWNKVQNLLPKESEQSYVQNFSSNNNIEYSSRQKSFELPESLRGWNWGAFYFSWLWAVCNGIYWPLVMLIPFLGLIAWPVIAIILGINGNQWAWEKRKWRSVEHFEKVQHTWAMIALWVFLGSIILGFLFVILIANVNR